MLIATTATAVPWVEATAMLVPTASMSTAPVTVALADDPPRACTAAPLVISASALAPPPAMPPIVRTADSPWAKLAAFASTVRPLPEVTVPLKKALVAPAMTAVGRAMPTATSPPAPACDFA